MKFPTITPEDWRRMFAAHRAQGHFNGNSLLAQLRRPNAAKQFAGAGSAPLGGSGGNALRPAPAIAAARLPFLLAASRAKASGFNAFSAALVAATNSGQSLGVRAFGVSPVRLPAGSIHFSDTTEAAENASVHKSVVAPIAGASARPVSEITSPVGAKLAPAPAETCNETRRMLAVGATATA